MRAVADAGPLIHLSWINELGLLALLFDQVFVPPAVRDEVLAPPVGTLGLEYLQEVFAANRLHVKSLEKPSPLIPDAGATLDLGEVEVILLAEEIHADLLVTDDAPARAEAERHGLRVVGSVGMLLQARVHDLIPAALPLILELRRLGQWMSDALVEMVREEEAGARD